MRADRKELRESIARLERELWRAGRGEEAPASSPGFEAGVMRRIRRKRAALSSRNFLELLGVYSWRLAPAAAAVLILLTAIGFFIPSGSGRGWNASLNGGDILIRWMLHGGGPDSGDQVEGGMP